ncbi:hypothetical protein BV25DRAFT_1899574 [Artomyces pyxidatus]|uniref:Uncharacterized protein n=1 Tax=Artomyces pyxidatus TaxID=48021 RepID=A0ACB8T3W9_9AGAM|nr:hypothetical protein BV25DRAFT_1899574 [Artomyces pyxidatus]
MSARTRSTDPTPFLPDHIPTNMAFNYYQQNVPGWGTQQSRLGPPPVPGYQPLPNWSGLDYYTAHAMGSDPSMYHYAMSRLGSGAMGMGLHEARHWHRRAYGGLGEITRMLPAEIGSAAAYEAYRQFKYNSSAYTYVRGDHERMREALVGLAVAEAVRLWQDTGRAVDQYGLQVASESAAATASTIIGQGELDFDTGYHRGRHNSLNVFSGGGSAYGDDRYRRAMSSSPMPSYVGGGYPGGGYAGSGYAGSNYPASVGASPIGGFVGLPPSSPYSGGTYAQPANVYGGGNYPAGGYTGNYGATLGVPGYGAGAYAQPAPTLVIESPRHHHHHHRHGSSRRHRSLSRSGYY